MILKKITLNNFRNYNNLEMDLSPNINIICGNNAQGKTNFLESIYVLAFTKSHRCLNDNSLINFNSDFYKIDGIIKVNDIETNLEIFNSINSKKMKIDENYVKSISDYISKMKVIIFFPDDLEILKGSPLVRRRYINMEISQIDNNYYKVLQDYNKLLKIRNDLLKQYIKNNTFNKEYFDIITNYLINKQVILYKMRKKYIDKINLIISDVFYKLSGINDLKINYLVNTNIDSFDTVELKNILTKKFNDIYHTELKVGTTLIGPHRDEYEFIINDQNLKNFGSQGQQRMAILALKLSEIELIKKYINDSPILLLDDVFSELDNIKKNNLLSYLDQNIQTIITTTDLNNLDNYIIKNAKILKVNNGIIEN